MMKVKYYACPECNKKFKTLTGFGEHIDSIHPGLRPEDFSVARFFYFTKTGKTSGKCRICGKDTSWNEKSMKYNQFCDNPKCKETYAKEAKKRMRDKYGKTHLLNDPNQQRKMLEHRKISGKYKFPDGTSFSYTGSYERNFFEMMDKLMNWDTCDIISPSPHNYFYEYKNPNDKEHEGTKFYFPDVYIPSLNLEIEIKQQTSTNDAFNKQMRPREKAKDDVMKNNPSVNYLKLNDNDFSPFFEYLMKIQEAEPEDKDDVNFKATESFMDAYIDNEIDDEDEENISEEAALKNQEDIKYKYDEFINGDINLCFITGLSGSGKSTLAYSLAKSGAEVYELDDVVTPWRFTDEDLKEYGGMISSFFKVSKEWRLTEKEVEEKFKGTEDKFERDLSREFCEYAMDYADSHKDKKFVVEGVWLAYFMEPSMFQDYAVVIKGTSAIKSAHRAAWRDTGDAKGKLQKVGAYAKNMFRKGRLKAYIDTDKRDIEKWRKYFAPKIANENISEEVATESVIKDDEDLKYNMYKFGKGKPINIVFISGFSGSGKSTLAYKLAGNKNEYVCLDDIVSIYRFPDENLKKYGDLIYSFFTGVGKKYRIPCTTEPGAPNKWVAEQGFKDYIDYSSKACNAFLDYAKKYAKSHKDSLFVIEGIQIMCYDSNPEKYKDYAVIIKGTSAIKSWYRSFKRDMQEALNKEEKKEWAINKIRSIPDYSFINSQMKIWRSVLSKYQTISNESDLELEMEPVKSTVYFSDDISPEGVLKLYRAVGVELPGNVAVKLHSGEPGNQNFLGPDFWKLVIDRVGGTVVECNTAYGSPRDTTDIHKIVMTRHGWDKYFPVDIMDSDENYPDLPVPVEPHNILEHNLLGKHIENYNSMLVLSHFKGHPMGGYGGALKNISIGCASRLGKKQIHRMINEDKVSINANYNQDEFLQAMADAASTVDKRFKGQIVYINAMVNMSVDCDCVKDAADPCMSDIGILASTDPIALDRACLDIIHRSNDPGRDEFLKRVESRNGEKIIEYAERLGFGTSEYNLISISNKLPMTLATESETDWIEVQNAHELPTKITERWTITGKDGEEHTIVKLKDDDNTYRMKAEILVLNDKDEVFLQFFPDGSYDIPGGGMDAGDRPIDSVIRESKEEARMHLKDIQYYGDYTTIYPKTNKPPKWIKDNIPEGERWTAGYACVFVGRSDGTYTGYINKRDEDEMVEKGKWYKIDVIFNKLKPIHQKALRKYLNNPESLVSQKEIQKPNEGKIDSNKPANEANTSIGAEAEKTTTHIRIKEKWNITSPDTAQHTVVKLDNGKVYRTKSEVLLLDNTNSKILIYMKSDKPEDYDIPGGGWNIGETAKDAAIRETREEVRQIVKDIQYYGDYTFEYPKDGTPDWIKESVPEKDRWIGGYVSVFIARSDGNYTGYIQEVDRDDMVKKAKWMNLKEVYPKLKPIHQKAIDAYFNNFQTAATAGMEEALEPLVGGTNRYNISGVLNELTQIEIPVDKYIVTGETAKVLLNHQEYTSKLEISIAKSIVADLVKAGNVIVEKKDSHYIILGDLKAYIVDDKAIKNKNVVYVSGFPVESESGLVFATEKSLYSSTNRYPVFIILEFTGAPVGKIIGKFTGDEFTHAELALNAELSPMYSFGSKTPVPTKDANGFVIHDGPKDNFFRRMTTKYRIYVLYVNKKEYTLIKERLEYFIENKNSFKFDIAGLIRIFFGKDSEHQTEKYFCSRFVMDVINAGHHLDKAPSLYKPQDITKFEDVSLVNAGNDLYFYDAKITKRNMKLLRENKEDQIVLERNINWLPEEKPAMEGFHLANIKNIFDFMKKEDHHVVEWKEYLFPEKNLVGLYSLPPFVGARVIGGVIEIRGINYNLLKARIKKYYFDQSIYNIFIPKYNAMSYKRFERKKIGRSQIKIEYLYTEEFFALELVTMFTELGRRFRDKTYQAMAKTIYDESWLAEADKRATEVSPLNTNKLKNLRLELNDYQKEFITNYPILKAQLNLKGYILAFEQGLGKTITAVALSECLGVDHVYIVCPNSLKENWALEIKKYYKKYDDDDTWRSEVFICNDKPEVFSASTAKFIITNNESISKMYPFVLDGKNILVLDESHNFRNIDSKRVAELLELSKKLQCRDTLVMSGTPIKATPAEIVPALLLIDPTFNMEAAKIFAKTFKLQSSLGTSLVQKRFEKMIYRKEKDVLEDKLPPKHVYPMKVHISMDYKYTLDNVYSIVFERFSQIYDDGYKAFLALRNHFLEMTKRYSTKDMDYHRFEKVVTVYVAKSRESLHEIDLMFMEDYMTKVKENMKDKASKDQYDYYIKNYVRYRAHCLGVAFGEILPPYRRDMYIAMFDENKKTFEKMISENPKKTLIFTQFKGVATHIHEALNDDGIGAVLIDGDVTNRMEIIRGFKENPNIMVLVATSQTLGTGVTLTEANQMFFFGPPWRQSDFDQCSDRIHRIGQTDECYIYMVSLNTDTEMNLSDRMDEILRWSKTMVDASIHTTDNSDSNSDFKDVLTANEGFISLSDILKSDEE